MSAPNIPAGWIATNIRKPTELDAPNRLKRVQWLVCDGFVCEPNYAPWNWEPSSGCSAVAWCPIPVHPTYYPDKLVAEVMATECPYCGARVNGWHGYQCGTYNAAHPGHKPKYEQALSCSSRWRLNMLRFLEDGLRDIAEAADCEAFHGGIWVGCDTHVHNPDRKCLACTARERLNRFEEMVRQYNEQQHV